VPLTTLPINIADDVLKASQGGGGGEQEQARVFAEKHRTNRTINMMRA
jgi:hypothetical protein